MARPETPVMSVATEAIFPLLSSSTDLGCYYPAAPVPAPVSSGSASARAVLGFRRDGTKLARNNPCCNKSAMLAMTQTHKQGRNALVLARCAAVAFGTRQAASLRCASLLWFHPYPNPYPCHALAPKQSQKAPASMAGYVCLPHLR
jgi:hypothetical protein